MTAAAILARAEAAGVSVMADGDMLRLMALTPPPLALLHDLAGVKAEILDLLAERAAICDRGALTAARKRRARAIGPEPSCDGGGAVGRR